MLSISERLVQNSVVRITFAREPLLVYKNCLGGTRPVFRSISLTSCLWYNLACARGESMPLRRC